MAEQARHWSQLQERGSDLGLRLLVAIMRRFGRVLALPGVHLAVAYFCVRDALGARISGDYLQRVHDSLLRRGIQPSWQPGWIASYRHYLQFALTIVDRVALWGGSQDGFEFEIDDPDLFRRYQERGRGGIIMGAHMGNFDALRVLSVRDDVKVHVLMYTRHAPIVNTVFKELSPDAELRVIDPTRNLASLALEIKSLVERGEWIGILGDRIEPGERGKVCEVEFLGEAASFPLAPYRLALKLGCPIVSLAALREGAWRYHVKSAVLDSGEVRVPRNEQDAKALELLTAFVRELERHCLESPSQWFNWFPFWAQEKPE